MSKNEIHDSVQEQTDLCQKFIGKNISLKLTRPVLDRFHDSSKVKALSFMLYA